MVSEQAHDPGVLIQPHLARVSRQEHFFLLAKMNYSSLVPERNEFLRLPLNSCLALLRWSFRGSPHCKRLNQRKMMVLAQRVQARMTFQGTFRMQLGQNPQSKGSKSIRPYKS